MYVKVTLKGLSLDASAEYMEIMKPIQRFIIKPKTEKDTQKYQQESSS